MITTNFTIPSSSLKAKVELYNGSTLVKACTCSDVLQSFTVDRDEGAGKFFGFGICQSIKTVLIDLNRELNLTKGMVVAPAFGDGTNFINPYPTFYANEITRDEDTNAITVAAYDVLYQASSHTFNELGMGAPYTIREAAAACARLLGLTGVETLNFGTDTSFNTSYPDGANLSGDETIREVLDAIADATQSIYYINNSKKLVYKRLNIGGSPVFTITKDRYFSLSTGEAITLDAICNATELGDNVISGDQSGTIHYVRDNPFWNMRDDVGTLVDNALAAVGGMTINQFNCDSWEGNVLLEIGDKIGITAEDGSVVNSYLLNDTVIFDGTLEEATYWTYEENDNETVSNPTSLGEKLNQTKAIVDKANRRIEMVVGETEANTKAISALEINTESINLSVERVQASTDERLAAASDEISAIKKDVANFKISADEALLEFQKTIEKDGVSKVYGTGFAFDETGLTISNSGTEISTNLNSNGLAIYLDEIRTETNEETGEEVIINEAILTVEADGVKAENLHATTWLIIGNNSRIEDYGNRTGCYWLGGKN